MTRLILVALVFCNFINLHNAFADPIEIEKDLISELYAKNKIDAARSKLLEEIQKENQDIADKFSPNTMRQKEYLLGKSLRIIDIVVKACMFEVNLTNKHQATKEIINLPKEAFDNLNKVLLVIGEDIPSQSKAYIDYISRMKNSAIYYSIALNCKYDNKDEAKIIFETNKDYIVSQPMLKAKIYPLLNMNNALADVNETVATGTERSFDQNIKDTKYLCNFVINGEQIDILKLILKYYKSLDSLDKTGFEEILLPSNDCFSASEYIKYLNDKINKISSNYISMASSFDENTVVEIKQNDKDLYFVCISGISFVVNTKEKQIKQDIRDTLIIKKMPDNTFRILLKKGK